LAGSNDKDAAAAGMARETISRKQLPHQAYWQEAELWF